MSGRFCRVWPMKEAVGASVWCPLTRPATAPVLAVLGVFSTQSRRSLRDGIRDTWLQSAESSSIVTRFVMRAESLSGAALDEALLHRDTLYVRGDPNAVWGPLQSLTRWLECAVAGWPAGQLVGKADDDIWARLPDVALSLRASQVAWREPAVSVRRAAHKRSRRTPDVAPHFAPCTRTQALARKSEADGLLWGLIEAASWDEASRLPAGFFNAHVLSRAMASCNGTSKAASHLVPRLPHGPFP